MKLDGFGIFTKDIDRMAEFYRDVMGFELTWEKGMNNVFLEKDGTLFLLYGRTEFEAMTRRKFAYAQGIQGHYEMALSVPTFAHVDQEFARVVEMGATPVLPPETEPWGQRTCYVADPEGNLIEIGSFQPVSGAEVSVDET